MKHEMILEQLKSMGFEPAYMDDERYIFEYKGIKYLLRNEVGNEEFLSISIPVFYEFTEEDKMKVYENVNLINSLVKYVKLTISDEYVSVVYEHRMAAEEDLEELLEDIIHALSTAMSVYMKKMKDEKIPYLDYDPEEENAETDDSTLDSDVELESELEKLLEDVDD